MYKKYNYFKLFLKSIDRDLTKTQLSIRVSVWWLNRFVRYLILLLVSIAIYNRGFDRMRSQTINNWSTSSKPRRETSSKINVDVSFHKMLWGLGWSFKIIKGRSGVCWQSHFLFVLQSRAWRSKRFYKDFTSHLYWHF